VLFSVRLGLQVFVAEAAGRHDDTHRPPAAGDLKRVLSRLDAGDCLVLGEPPASAVIAQAADITDALMRVGAVRFIDA